MGDKINAGIYVLSPKTLERIELRPTSIEKETFPLIVRDKGLYAFTLPGYWMDVGQPKDYLTGGAQKLRRKGEANVLAGNGNRLELKIKLKLGVRGQTRACTPSPCPAAGWTWAS